MEVGEAEAHEQGGLLMVAVRRPHKLVESMTWFQGLLTQVQPTISMYINTGLLYLPKDRRDPQDFVY